VAEGARLESVYTFTGIGGSNPSLSAILHFSSQNCGFPKPVHPLKPVFLEFHTAIQQLGSPEFQY
jgi:hypothetical protein